MLSYISYEKLRVLINETSQGIMPTRQLHRWYMRFRLNNTDAYSCMTIKTNSNIANELLEGIDTDIYTETQLTALPKRLYEIILFKDTEFEENYLYHP